MKSLKDFLSDKKQTTVEEQKETVFEPQVLTAVDAENLMFAEEDGKQDNAKPMDPPAVLIMRRKQIRQFPGGQRVALYYVDKINKYITVPYTAMQWSATVEEEKSPFDVLTYIKESGELETITFEDGSKMTIKPQVAEVMLDLYNKLNYENRKKFVDSVNESKDSFQKLSKFALDNNKD